MSSIIANGFRAALIALAAWAPLKAQTAQGQIHWDKPTPNAQRAENQIRALPWHGPIDLEAIRRGEIVPLPKSVYAFKDIKSFETEPNADGCSDMLVTALFDGRKDGAATGIELEFNLSDLLYLRDVHSSELDPGEPWEMLEAGTIGGVERWLEVENHNVQQFDLAIKLIQAEPPKPHQNGHPCKAPVS